MGRAPKDVEQGERLIRARKAKGFDTAAAAIKKFGWAYSTYQAHENGQNGIPPAAAVQYGKAFGVDPGWILTGHGKGLGEEGRDYDADQSTEISVLRKREIIEIAGEEFVQIPIYDVRAAAGFGSVNYDETPTGYFPIAKEFLRRITDTPPDFIAILEVSGHSMNPTLHDRDLAFVDLRRNRLTREGIYALNFEGDTIVKRAQQHMESGIVTLTSDNSLYKPQVIKNPDRLHVIGQVFWSLTRH